MIKREIDKKMKKVHVEFKVLLLSHYSFRVCLQSTLKVIRTERFRSLDHMCDRGLKLCTQTHTYINGVLFDTCLKFLPSLKKRHREVIMCNQALQLFV